MGLINDLGIDPKEIEALGPIVPPPDATKEETVKAILSPLHQAMEDAGITAPYLMKKLKEELEAEKTEFFSFRGDITGARNVVDWGTRQRARMDAHKIRGDYAPETHKIDLNESRTYSETDREILKETARHLAQSRIAEIRKKAIAQVGEETPIADTNGTDNTNA